MKRNCEYLLNWLLRHNSVPDGTIVLTGTGIIPPPEFSLNKKYHETLKLCHSTVGTAILNTSITIVFGFSILVFSNFIPTIYFGVFTGIAMLLAMISVLTLLPKLILIIKPFGTENN